MPEEWKRLNSEVKRLVEEGRYREAIPLAERAVSVVEKALGGYHPDVVTSLAATPTEAERGMAMLRKLVG